MKALTEHHHARALVVVAHCDDESLFCGGTLRILRDNGCEISVIVTAKVSETNAPRDESIDDGPRQRRRLVAFGRACGMLDVSRVHMLETRNHRGGDSDEERYRVAREISERLAPILLQEDPSVVFSHGEAGEYGHAHHALVSEVVRHSWVGPLWEFSADGPVLVRVDLPFKRRLLDCYRYGTTQDPHWTPYAESDPKLAPWLGVTEPFRYRG